MNAEGTWAGNVSFTQNLSCTDSPVNIPSQSELSQVLLSKDSPLTWSYVTLICPLSDL